MKTVELYAPESYNRASTEVIAQVVNGCGSSGWKGRLVPNYIWFLSIKEACNRHDWMYTVGKTLADKEEADRAFLNNMLRIIDAAGGPFWLRDLRKGAAYGYYEAVVRFGGPAFWDKTNEPACLKIAPVTYGVATA